MKYMWNKNKINKSQKRKEKKKLISTKKYKSGSETVIIKLLASKLYKKNQNILVKSKVRLDTVQSISNEKDVNYQQGMRKTPDEDSLREPV